MHATSKSLASDLIWLRCHPNGEPVRWWSGVREHRGECGTFPNELSVCLSVTKKELLDGMSSESLEAVRRLSKHAFGVLRKDKIPTKLLVTTDVAALCDCKHMLLYLTSQSGRAARRARPLPRS